MISLARACLVVLVAVFASFALALVLGLIPPPARADAGTGAPAFIVERAGEPGVIYVGKPVLGPWARAEWVRYDLRDARNGVVYETRLKNEQDR